MVVYDGNEQLDYEDVLLKPQRTNLRSRKDVCLLKNYLKTNGDLITRAVPIMNSNMSTVGNFKVAKAMLDDNMFATIHKHYTVEEIVEFMKSLTDDERHRLFISIGLRDAFINYDKLMEIRRILQYSDYFPGQICIDVPNAYIDEVINLVKKVSESTSGSLIMVGNVCTSEGVEALSEAGAHIVKVGVGPGSHCRTRFVTGVGRPQFSTVVECVEAANGLGVKICADGGISQPGDVVKALAAGAEFVMLGRFYAGTDEAEGEFYKTEDHQVVKLYYGMASETAQKKFYGGIDEYKTSEGKKSMVPYEGSVHDQNLKIMGGLRSACTYCNASNLNQLAGNAVFYKVRRQHTVKE